MATPKIWTANDVKQGRLYLNPLVAGFMLVERDYQFVDGLGVALPNFGTQTLSVSVEWLTIPQNIKDALIAIDTWVYNQILGKEGMT